MSRRMLEVRRWLRGPGRPLLLVLLGAGSLVLALLACDLLLRVAGVPRYGRFFPGEPHPELRRAAYIEPDPDLGWVSNRSLPEINPQGFRDPRDFAALEPGAARERVLVLGDSFMWGVGVELAESVPRLLEARLGERFEVHNLSVPGWGIDQMYLAYRRHVDRLAPDHVILAFIDDDVDRVLEAYRPWEGLGKPCLTLRDGQLVARTSAAGWERLANKLLWRSVLLGNLLRQIFLATDAVPVVRAIFGEMAAEAAAAGRSFALLRIPLRDRALRRAPHLRVERFSGAERVSLLDAADALQQADGGSDGLYREDGHLSAAGSRVIAELLRRQLVPP